MVIKRKLSFSVHELIALLEEILSRDILVNFRYITNNKSKIGIRHCSCSCLGSADYNNNEIELIFNGKDDSFNSLAIIIPEEKKENINCLIEHNQIEKIAYDKLSKIEKQRFLLGSSKNNNQNFEKYIYNTFELSFDDFAFKFDMEDKEFYSILENLEKYTTDYAEGLRKAKLQDREVDIDGFWESIDKAME